MAADQPSGDFFDQFGGSGAQGAAPPAAPGGAPAPPATAPAGQPSFGNLSDPSAWMALANDPQKLDQWIASQAPWMSTQLRQYYAGIIKGQPGANPTEQAGSANYYIGKFNQDPNNPKGMNLGAIGGQGTSPWLQPYDKSFAGPSLDDLQNMPGWQFALQNGVKALDTSAAAKGTVLNGGEKKDILNYATGLLSQTAQQGWENSLNSYLTNYNVFKNNGDSQFNRFNTLAQSGTNAAGAATS